MVSDDEAEENKSHEEGAEQEDQRSASTSLLASPTPSSPPAQLSPSRTVMGLVTSGGFSYKAGGEQGVAFVNGTLLQQLLLSQARARTPSQQQQHEPASWMVLVRTPRARTYHAAWLRLVK